MSRSRLARNGRPWIAGCWCLLMVLCTALKASAQPPLPNLTLSIEGGVTDANGNDVANAIVTLYGPTGQTLQGRTNRFGQFAIGAPLVPGVYTVAATVGSISVKDTVRVPAAAPDASRAQIYVVNLALDDKNKVSGAYQIPVYFATTRRQIAGSPPQYSQESTGPSKSVTLGYANVNMPLRHKTGRIESAVWELLADADRHIGVTSGGVLTAAQFAAQARGANDDALVFVHGFNVLFDEALRTAAQVAYDIGFRGAVLLYSWPSGSALPIPSELKDQYTFAQSQIDQGAEYVQLASFLQDVRAQHYGRVHLLAHSMGAYLSVRAFGRLKGPKWTNLLFAAPDVGQAVFDAEAAHIASLSRALVVYFNPNDRALMASQMQNWQFPRTGAQCTTFPSIECIDASNVSTSQTRHSYYSDSRSILSDIRLVTCKDAPPSQRALLPTAVANAWTVSDIPAAQPKMCGP